ncbi:hypothetical protein Q8A73_000971 [Channa argus]|nr:hypothetical protein Q8A73_000971 [Channa argus]
MNKFLGDAVGADGVAKMAGKKAATLVEDTVKTAMGGKKKDDKKQEGGGGEAGAGGGGGGGFGVDDALSLVTGKKEGGKGGFNIGDVLK